MKLTNDTPICYVPSDEFIEGHGYRVAIVYPGRDGYFPTGVWPKDGTQTMPWFVPGPTWHEAYEQVMEMNERRGISREDAERGINESMRLARKNGTMKGSRSAQLDK